MSLSKEQTAVISDRRRLSEVRKYCQVRPALGRNKVSGGKPSKELQAAGAATSHTALLSLLQLLVGQLDADIAMVSLLYEETQFFLAGAGRDNNEPAVESARWFGCDRVSHYGGLCERTVTVDRTHDPAIYEELDMSGNPRTSDLPYVDGTLANFRNYAGAPVETAASIPIGTVFVMSCQPSSGLRAFQRQLLTDTAANVMRQLTLTLQALEGERLIQFQGATAALLQRQPPLLHQQGLPRRHSGISQQPSYVVEVYQYAAEVMRRSLELEGVFFQHVSADDRTSQVMSASWQDSMLAASLNTESNHPIFFSHSEVNKITQMLERVKSDFLGSVSHEMKTPLHQTLGNLELLQQTSCSDEQYDLAVNARFGATQLFETIEKILLYSSISSEPNAKPEMPSKIDMVLDEKEAPQIIGPRIEHVAGGASTVDLFRMCEEAVEDTTRRMRLLETIMSPSEQQDEGQDGVLCPDLPVQRADGIEKDPFTIVVFDVSPIESVQVPRNTGLRIVLENLLV
jgi:signal transduction histidine kinase